FSILHDLLTANCYCRLGHRGPPLAGCDIHPALCAAMAESDDGASKDFIILGEPVPEPGVQSESEICEAILIARSFSKITFEDLLSRSRRELFDSALCYLKCQVLNLPFSGADWRVVDYSSFCAIFCGRNFDSTGWHEDHVYSLGLLRCCQAIRKIGCAFVKSESEVSTKRCCYMHLSFSNHQRFQCTSM